MENTDKNRKKRWLLLVLLLLLLLLLLGVLFCKTCGRQGLLHLLHDPEG